MKLTLLHHLGNPNMCRIPELDIRQMPECEGGGWYLPRSQAEAIVSAVAFEAKCQADGWERATSALSSKQGRTDMTKGDTASKMNETAHTPTERETIDELLAALTALVAMVEKSAAGLVHPDTRKTFKPGVSDMAINPEHTLFLSDARAAISKATAPTAPEGTRT